jgi:hypothetical protein
MAMRVARFVERWNRYEFLVGNSEEGQDFREWIILKWIVER